MPFSACHIIEAHKCRMSFGKATLKIRGQELACNDRYGRPLRTKVQVIGTQVVPPGREQLILKRMTISNYCPIGLVEGLHQHTRPERTVINLLYESHRATTQASGRSSTRILHECGRGRHPGQYEVHCRATNRPPGCSYTPSPALGKEQVQMQWPCTGKQTQNLRHWADTAGGTQYSCSKRDSCHSATPTPVGT